MWLCIWGGMVQFGQLRTQGSPDTISEYGPSHGTALVQDSGRLGLWPSIDFLEIPTERSLPVFYRMKPENISCEASVFPTENRGLFLNSTSEDILKDCVIVDKFGIHELFICETGRSRTVSNRQCHPIVWWSLDKPNISYQRNITAYVNEQKSDAEFFCDLNHLGKLINYSTIIT